MSMKTIRLLSIAVLMTAIGCSDDDGGPSGPVDSTAPTVESVSPANGSTGQPVGTSLGVQFSEPVDAATLDASTFRVRLGASAVSGDLTVDGASVTFAPTAPLAGQSTYTTTLTTGVKDLAGNALAQDYVWSFSTADVSAPSITNRVPAPNATGVSVSANVVITFSESIAAGSVSSNTVRLKQGATPIGANLSVSGSTVTLDPSSNLNSLTVYTVEVTTGVTDLGGNALGSAVSWSFTTQDAVAPTVTQVSPANGATKVDIDANLVVTFSESIKASSVTSNTFTVRADTWLDSVYQPLVAGQITVNGNTITFKPTRGSWQEYLTGYTVSLTSGIQDLAGNAMAPFSSTFRSVMFDEGYYYTFHNELQGKARALDTYTNSYRAHMALTSSNTSGSRWYARPNGNEWGLRNAFGGNGLYLEGGTGADPAFLAQPAGAALYSGQAWSFQQVSGRLGVPTTPPAPKESPVSYRLRTEFQGAARSLTLRFSSVNNVYEAVMGDDSNYVGSWWFFTNVGAR